MATQGRLLILGASGFLGAHVLRVAQAARAAHIIAVARRPPKARLHGSSGAPAAEAAREERVPGESLVASPVEWLGLDARDSDALAASFARIRPTACILTAAMSRMGACEEDPAGAQEMNALVPEYVANLARAHSVRLIHVSTDLVFDGSPPRAKGYREGDEPAALSVYGRTKAEGEERVLRADPEAIVVRLPLLYGDSMGRGLGASDQLLEARARGQRPTLFTDEVRSPLDVGDAARALIELAVSPAAAAPVQRLHVAGPVALDRFRFGVVVLRSLGLDEETIESALERGSRVALGLDRLRPANVALDAERARGLLKTPLRAPAEVLGRR